MPIFAAMPQKIAAAAEIVRRGGLVALPTETVYGLGADALNATASARIFEVKERPFFDPLIVHVCDWQTVERLTQGDLPLARRLANQFWPGPLTLVLPKSGIVPDIVTAGLPTVALRMPAHPVALELIRQSQTPIAAPSANMFGRLSPTTAEHVAEQLGGRVEFILDGGPCAVGVESTIVDLSGPTPRLLRPGGISLEDLRAALGVVEVGADAPISLLDTVGASTRCLNSTRTGTGLETRPTVSHLAPSRPSAPGQLPSHYATRTPLVLFEGDPPAAPQERRAGLLTLQPSSRAAGFTAAESLSAAGDLTEAAVKLFGSLHRLDAAGLDIIYAEAPPEQGLGRAIMDRLRRAAASV